MCECKLEHRGCVTEIVSESNDDTNQSANTKTNDDIGSAVFDCIIEQVRKFASTNIENLCSEEWEVKFWWAFQQLFSVIVTHNLYYTYRLIAI